MTVRGAAAPASAWWKRALLRALAGRIARDFAADLGRLVALLRGEAGAARPVA